MATQSKKKINAWWYAMPGVGPALASANKSKIKTNTKKANLTEKDKEDARKETELINYQKNKPKGGYTAKNAGPDKGVAGKKFVPKNKKNGNKPKLGGGAKQIQKRLRKAGFSQEELNKLGSKHQAWKAARKAGTLADWEEKYHPGRGRYKNKKKKTETKKTDPKKNKNKLKTGNTMPSNPPSQRQEGVGETAKDLTRHKKKKLGSRLASMFD